MPDPFAGRANIFWITGARLIFVVLDR